MGGSSPGRVWGLDTHVKVTSGSLGVLLRGIGAPVPLSLLRPLEKQYTLGAGGSSCFQISPALAQPHVIICDMVYFPLLCEAASV